MVPEPKVEFTDTESLDAAKRSSRKTKITVIGVLALVLLLCALLSLTFFVILRKPASTRLAEVNLEVDETLTYRVDHKIERRKGNVQESKSNHIFTRRVWNHVLLLNRSSTRSSFTQIRIFFGLKNLHDVFLVILDFNIKLINFNSIHTFIKY